MMRILRVDDEEKLVTTMAERLSLMGVEAGRVTIGDAALL